MMCFMFSWLGTSYTTAIESPCRRPHQTGLVDLGIFQLCQIIKCQFPNPTQGSVLATKNQPRIHPKALCAIEKSRSENFLLLASVLMITNTGKELFTKGIINIFIVTKNQLPLIMQNENHTSI